jgi:integrase
MEIRDATIVSVLFLAGLRPGECLALRWSDIAADRISITKSVSLGEVKEPKTRRHRTVPIISALRSDLLQWRIACGGAKGSDLVFPSATGGLWNDGYYRRWRRFTFKPAVEAAGLPRDTRIYDLRHANASTLIASGLGIVNVARRLGHSPTMCLSTYAHVIDAWEGKTIDFGAEVQKARDGSRLGSVPAISRTHRSRGLSPNTGLP